jgi:membrane protease YdiL (CAAX protease family)
MDPNSNPFQPDRHPSPTGEPYPVVEVEIANHPPRRGHIVPAVLAWLLIIAITLLHVILPYIRPPKTGQQTIKAGLLGVELQGKLLLGLKELGGAESNSSQLTEINSGPLENRYCYVILVNEVQGAKEAIGELAKIQQLVADSAQQPSEELSQTGDTLNRLFMDYEQEAWQAPSVGSSERDALVAQLDWFGELALTVEHTADQQKRAELEQNAYMVTVVLLGVMIFGFLFFCLGCAGLLIFVVFVALGGLKYGTENDCGRGRIYIETFAIWFLLFLLVQIVFAFLAPKTLILEMSLLGSLIAMSALLWPVCRGVRFGEMLTDVGLRCKNIFVEIFWGFVCYICTLPILFLGGLVMLVLIAAFHEQPDKNSLHAEPVSHPLMEWVTQAGAWQFLMIGILTTVAAPLVEETVFRGLMYRHFRDATHRWGRLLSVLFSASLNGLIFAAIHPQGILVIPVLGALAFSFSLVREWRGSLFSSMTMHSLHNGMITLLLLFMCLT